MRFIELPVSPCSCLSQELLKSLPSLDKKDLIEAVREHRLYFMNKAVPFLPFKVFKKGKVQIFLKDKGWEIKKSDLLYEDKWLIAINKPAGLPSQAPIDFTKDHVHSAVKSLLWQRKPQKLSPLFLLHRLDMDTSGVLLFSKKASINKGMQDLFEKKKIQKTYWALSQSESQTLPPSPIRSYLARKGDHIHKFKFASVDKNHKGAKFAETDLELLKQDQNFYLFKVQPKTGRSHQIRVHLKESGFPILGDPFYEGEKASHLFLHAKSVEFKHPESQEKLKIEAPLPPHWQKQLAQLAF